MNQQILPYSVPGWPWLTKNKPTTKPYFPQTTPIVRTQKPGDPNSLRIVKFVLSR